MGCDRIVRGGRPCSGKRLNYRVGPKNLTLCNKHLNQYKDHHSDVLARVKRDHETGLHGEGEDRRQFAENHEDSSGEYIVFCQFCLDELAGEELGVKPDQVHEAAEIKRAMDTALKEEASVVQRFKEEFESNPLRAVQSRADAVVYSCGLAGHYRRVQMLTELEQMNHETGERYRLNIVEAFERVKEEVTNDLIENRLNDEGDRSAASRFIRRSRW